jgi:MinD superfamily P-loop ATPase
MKRMVILSGKGGTGKTSISAAFAHLSSNHGQAASSVLVDADVDAANLSLVLKPQSSEPHEFWGGSLAEIDINCCSGCGTCVSVCRYEAVFPDANNYPAYTIDPLACDGCAACVYACPQNAVHMVPQQEGHWYHSLTPFGDLFHAELFPGKENSGKLVTLVKQQARLWAEETHAELLIIDGPPGLGCPVISACAGVELGLIVTEPGLAGLHDLKRILGTLQHFRVPAVICINKADLYLPGTKQIRDYAAGQKIEVLGEIPFDEHMQQSMFLGVPITAEFPESPAGKSIRALMEAIYKRLDS